MNARCETIGKYVLPVFRSLVAKELVNTYHFTQVEAAEKLGTTQAAVSQYINAKRAFKGTEKFSGVLPPLQAIAEETARRLAKNEIHVQDVAIDFCHFCPVFCCRKIHANEDYSI